MSVGDWDIYAQCQCGWRTRAPFGSRFHIHKEVCPDCGEPKRTWALVTGRYGNDGFELLPKAEATPTPSGCLTVHTTTAAVALLALGWWFT